MFRTLIYPSSAACDCVDELPHRSSCSQFVVYWRFGVAGFAGWSTSASACKTNNTQNQPHQISNTPRTENKTTDVVIQQHSRKLLMMDILMSETCWAHKKWNKIASDIKLVFHTSTITIMHGPLNIRRWLSVAVLLHYGSTNWLSGWHLIFRTPSKVAVTKMKFCFVLEGSRNGCQH